MKEKTVISYSKGITHSPSDLLCGDGELEECVNLEVKNGELVPMEMPVKLPFYLESNERLVLVHNMKTFGKNYFVIADGTTLKCFKVVDGSRIPFSATVECGDFKSIQAVGNTVVVYSSTSPHYLVYADGIYKYLGSTLPTLELVFNLEGKCVVSEIFEVNVPSLSDGDDDTADNPDLSTDENKKTVTQTIISQVNKFIAEESEEKGLFIFPFLVRYAYRLFDGNYVMQSSPVLMMPSTTMAPICGFLARQDKRPPFKTFVGAIPSYLTVRKSSSTFKFGDWADIISSVSIFVSSPFRTYDQEGEIESWSYRGKLTPSTNSVFYGLVSSKGYESKYSLDSLISETTPEEGDSTVSDHNIWDLPQKETGDIISEIAGCSLFYKYASYSPDYIDSNSGWTIKPEEVGVNPVGGIELNETLPDDYMTHDTLIPESSFVYNSRLNISNIQRYLFKGYSATSLTWRVWTGVGTGTISDYYVYTYIKTLDGTVIVKSPSSYAYSISGCYLFYPDTDAYKMVIHDTTNGQYVSVPLTEHSGLNGAYYFNGFTDLEFQSGDPGISETELQSEHLSNKLFTSDVNNPFRFPLAGINTVGSGEILGISAITRPISQGQFGEYPMIAFCSDGNFALKVDTDGFYSGISPVQEDLVLGSDKITSMENSVLVVTKKGIMLATGNEMNKITGAMEGGVYDYSKLESISTSVTDIATLVESAKNMEGFLTYVYGSRMAFDYASNRVLIYNPERTHAYFYSFENDTVTKLVVNGGANIVASVIDYPDTIIQDSKGILYSLYNKEDLSVKDERMYGMALTRPLKIDAALHMKAIRQIMHLSSNCGNGSYVKYILYGSNDNVNYYRVSSRFGKPYKYYRVAIYTYLLPKESLSGSVLTTEERRTHKLR